MPLKIHTVEQYPKPFIKWVGGKRQLLDQLQARLPAKINTYYEPFIGGGALMWEMKNKAKRIVISDFNQELTNLYRTVKNDTQHLIKCLVKHINTEPYYYEIRKMDRCLSYSKMGSTAKAGRFIFLNKTGYNGLYRVNSKGQHNVPFGRYKNPNIVDDNNLNICSHFLQHVEILEGDFEVIKHLITKNDLIYLDPPYAPLTATSYFTGYTNNGFDSSMQKRLKDFCDYINSVGANFMLSNSSAPLIYNLYKDYNIDEVMANRAVNCKASGRGKVTELILRNYDN